MNKKYLALIGSFALLLNLTAFADGELGGKPPVPTSDPANSGDGGAPQQNSGGAAPKVAIPQTTGNEIPFLNFGTDVNLLKNGDVTGLGAVVGGGIYYKGGVYQLQVSASGNVNKDTTRDGGFATIRGSIDQGGYHWCGSQDSPAGKYVCIGVGADAGFEHNFFFNDRANNPGKVNLGAFVSPEFHLSLGKNSDFRVGPSLGGEMLYSNEFLPEGRSPILAGGIAPFTHGIVQLETPILTLALNGGHTFDLAPDNNVASFDRINGTVFFQPLPIGDVSLGLYGQGKVEIANISPEKDGAKESGSFVNGGGQAGILISFDRASKPAAPQKPQRPQQDEADDAEPAK